MTAEEMFDAVRRDDIGVVDALLAETPRLVDAVDEHAKTPLHWAAELDRAAIAGRLIAAGAALEPHTVWGMTPLQWGGVMGATGVGEVLLAAGAQLNLPTAAGLGMSDAIGSFWVDASPADWAREGDHEDIAALLERHRDR